MHGCHADHQERPGKGRREASLSLEIAEPDWADLPVLARQWDLTAYDAAYLQLALKRRLPLVTLDARLAAAYDRASRLSQRR